MSVEQMIRDAWPPTDPRAREMLGDYHELSPMAKGNLWRRITVALWQAEHAGFLRARAAAARIPERLGCGCDHGLHAEDCPAAIADAILALEDSP